MKRSHAIALGATGIIVAGAWLGNGSTRVGDDTPTVEAGIYADAAECISAGVLTRDVCEAEFKKATEAHVAAAPKYADKATCEAQYGASQCRTTTFNGASVFVPAMIGMLVANHLSNQRQSQPLYPQAGAMPPCQPGMTPQTQAGCSPTRSYSTSSGSTIFRSSGISAAATRVPTSAVTAPVARSSIIPSGTPRSTPTSSPASSNSVARGGFGSTGHATSSSSSS